MIIKFPKIFFFMQRIGIPILLFVWAFLLRQYFFCGFVLADDAQEFPMIQHILNHGPILTDQLHARFTLWIFNLIFCNFFGFSETSLFFPTLLLSSSLSLFGYLILLNRGYSLGSSWLAGLMIASAPFEILTGVVRMNDLFLTWFLIMALWALLNFNHRPIVQGIIVAVCLYLGFYAKLWIIYMLPFIFLYYGWQVKQKRTRKGLFGFLSFSFILHGMTFVFWKLKTGSCFPVINKLDNNFAVPIKYLLYEFSLYPKIIFKGSEFDTTIFGAIPYLLVIALITKLVICKWFSRDHKLRMDSLDFWLFFYYMSFFVFLNFIPNAFVFDKYISVPRIFRYLAPISFPMTLHLAKLTIDIFSLVHKHTRMRLFIISIVFCFMIGLNLYHSAEATQPGRAFRKNLKLAIQEIKQECPSKLLVDSWLAYFIKNIYLNSQNNKTNVFIINGGSSSHNYETWLIQNEPMLQNGTMLLTGFGSYLYYKRHNLGFRLALFRKPLSSGWKIHKEFGTLDYHPISEPVRLWKLSREQ